MYSFTFIIAVFVAWSDNYVSVVKRELASIYFGLHPKGIRKLVYQVAVKNGSTAPKNWEKNQMAGAEWFINFMQRNEHLSLRTPEATSLARTVAFKPTTVEEFFSKLQYVIDKFKISDDVIDQNI